MQRLETMQQMPGFTSFPRYADLNILEAIQLALEKTHRLRRPITFSTPYLLQRHMAQLKAETHEAHKAKVRRVRRELLEAGVTMYGLLKAESRHICDVLHDNEHIEAAVYGQHHSSSVMLFATDDRIIFFDKKPTATLLDEVSYEVVSGIEFDIHLFTATLVLHTPVKNYDIKFANLRCAQKFAQHIENKRLEKKEEEEEKIHAAETIAEYDARKLKNDTEQATELPFELKEDMAGYYWLPVDEEERDKLQSVVE